MRRLMRKVMIVIAVLVALISTAFAETQEDNLIFCSPLLAMCNDEAAQAQMTYPMLRETFALGCSRARLELDNLAFSNPEAFDRLPKEAEFRVALFRATPKEVRLRQIDTCLKWFRTGHR